ncbi:hypothetical protein K2173_024495 [Erythroxylum novogranatense]|uniref:PGG domain-containing protein n=1 Tax=Erythroxylum novogranatense TaxID=1862640 RepID=A0AAV8SUJ3_9ROSI|nr:hypothetical protein K2173_024495 [Erythroxylum novogranatense]
MATNDDALSLKLYKAALLGDWDTARRIFMHESARLSFTTGLTVKNETALHIAVGTGHSNMFVEKLLDMLPVADVEYRDVGDSTALHLAAIVGNLEAVKLMVQKNPSLPQMTNKLNILPIHEAARHDHSETVRYLLDRSEAADPSLFSGEHGIHLLNLLIFADSYDIALKLLRKHPELATKEDSEQRTPLELLSKKPQAFYSGYQVGFFTRLIYQRCQDPNCSYVFFTWFRPLQNVYDKKLTHLQALEMVKIICQKIVENRETGFEEKLTRPAFDAAKLGIQEIVTEIVKAYPYAIWLTDEENRNVIHLAVEHRQENVYNLLYQLNLQRYFATGCLQGRRTLNSILHLAATLNPSHRVSGAALQMQRELQWFKEVENVIEPSFREKINKDKETPRQMFSMLHKDLAKQGEKWMKGVATSCSVVAALIATVVFAAAFTVPGGNRDGKGIPFFLNKPSFTVFAAADAIALFSSITAVFMFLGILTSRYDEEDFLISLPTKLSIGLITLFISIASMVIGFSASLYIVLNHRPKFLIPIILLAAISAASFAWIQFPLLAEVASSTFGRSIFGPQSKEVLYGSNEDDLEALYSMAPSGLAENQAQSS